MSSALPPGAGAAAESEHLDLTSVKMIDTSEDEDESQEEQGGSSPGGSGCGWGTGSPGPGEDDDDTKEMIVPELVDCKAYYNIDEDSTGYFIEVPPETPAPPQLGPTPSPNWPVLEINPMDTATDAAERPAADAGPPSRRWGKLPIIAPMVYSCGKCDKGFKLLNELTRHLNSHKSCTIYVSKKKATPRKKLDAKEKKLIANKRNQKLRALARKRREARDWN